ncbi:MAG: hypothetical protein IPM54_00020 [Polyangiaceae bacterium]|nr:hypothetical protein [Polyangiaceae bacterium]
MHYGKRWNSGRNVQDWATVRARFSRSFIAFNARTSSSPSQAKPGANCGFVASSVPSLNRQPCSTASGYAYPSASGPHASRRFVVPTLGRKCLKLLICPGPTAEVGLGDGTIVNKTMPVALSGLMNIIALTAGDFHTCALLTDGTARCLGYNNEGGLGDGTNVDKHIPVPVLNFP